MRSFRYNNGSKTYHERNSATILHRNASYTNAIRLSFNNFFLFNSFLQFTHEFSATDSQSALNSRKKGTSLDKSLSVILAMTLSVMVNILFACMDAMQIL